MIKPKWIFIILFAVMSLGAAFYSGRVTVNNDLETDARPGETEKHDHDADNTDDGDGLVILSPEAREQFQISVVKAQTRAVRQPIEATGSVLANETRIAHIRPLARGRIHEVYVRPGDQVRAGQSLLSYDNIELGEALGEYVSARADVGKGSAETDVARQALDRARALVDLGAIAKAELQKREADYRNAVLQTEGQKALAARIEEKLHRFGMTDAEIADLRPDAAVDYHRKKSHSVLRAPHEGIVTQFDASIGENVSPEDTLLSLSDLSTVWVLADIYEKDIRFVKAGSVAEVRAAAYPDRVFPGKITHINDILDPQTRTAKVRVEVGNSERLLKLEMFAAINIPTMTERRAIAIPSEAVHEIEGREIVFTPKEDGYEMRQVAIGAKGGAWVEISGGLQDGDEVVTEGSFLLKSEAMKAELGHEH
ncbi:MAG: efflux RND transporter periplasmic adaptor subunit [Acidobacteriota bacterium]|jgi:cobalt-zinc-cadmium efflux system membrane fusion protein|nr:efflux RND transporter periplasmic adaptor subunit [Acidobacteriota bacterium]